MNKYSTLKSSKVNVAVRLFCVFLALTFSACGTKKPAVPSTKPDSSNIAPSSPVKEEPVKPLIEMVLVKGGMFNMGLPNNKRSYYKGLTNPPPWPSHYVTLDDFYIGIYEVTQGQYIEVMGKSKNPSTNGLNPDNPEDLEGRLLPVEGTNWYDTLVFCNKLSIKEKLKPVYIIDDSVNPDDWGDTPRRISGTVKWNAVRMDRGANGYRLPTEAEWEFAARGGTVSRDFDFAGSSIASEVAWYDPRDGGRTITNLHGVGSKKANELGLYDMSGNVMEWCWDWEGPYSSDTQTNPLGPPMGNDKILRGGGWSDEIRFCYVVTRHKNFPYYRGMDIGFRVVRNK